MLGLILLLQAIVVVVSGPPTSPEYLPIRIADAYGYFAREQLTVTLRSTRAESGAAEALAQGQADLAATSLEAMLRYGARTTSPRLVFGLTAAPPVALLVAGPRVEAVRTVKDLANGKVGFTNPGSPEQTWLQAMLARSGLAPLAVEMVSLGAGLVSALDRGEVTAAFVAEPAAATLVRDGRAHLLVDLRSPRAVMAALGTATVNGAVFARSDRRPSDRVLAAFARAVLAAERRLASEPPAALGARLPRHVVGTDEEFARRLDATQRIYLPNGLVTPEAAAYTIEIMRAHLPLPVSAKVPTPAELLYLAPLRRALTAKPPA
jgi:NitT/TauT family transport system substrate-binding protein